MRRSIYRFFLLFVCILGMLMDVDGQIRIMPMGNSITYDNNSLDSSDPRPSGDRISYRYKLYQLLFDAGYEFDYVGNENCGFNYFQDSELDDNAGFSGVETYQLEEIINSGYNGRDKVYESFGPYLNYYPTDIILLHIGTNALIESAYQVEDLLDKIRFYDPDVYILVARIINRRTYNASTTVFNNNVELMVNMRGDSRIIMVDMEYGAGLDYSNDMIDNLHPKPAGFEKMAIKWFDAIDNLNQRPTIFQIPEQFSTRNNAFEALSLDDYVYDLDDEDEDLIWTFTAVQNSNLNISIDENRLLSVSPVENWFGNETLTLKVEDTGNGTFVKEQTMEVLFTVEQGNAAPVFTSQPITSVYENGSYYYVAQAVDNDDDEIVYSAVDLPSWLEFDASSLELSGMPFNENVGMHSIALRAYDGYEETDQIFDLEVINVNDPPSFISDPDTASRVKEIYIHRIIAEDKDDDTLQFIFLTKPDWVTVTVGLQDALLYGIPTDADIGSHAVIVEVSDGEIEKIQGFTIKVGYPTSTPNQELNSSVKVYPNPAVQIVNFKVDQPGEVQLHIYNSLGVLLESYESDYIEQIEVDVSSFERGFYFYQLVIDGDVVIGKFVKN